MEKLDAAYEGPAGLARLNQILQMAPLRRVSLRSKYEMKIAFLSLPFTKRRAVSLTMYSWLG